MICEKRTAALRRGWYPVTRAVDLDGPQQATLLGRRLVTFRAANGHPHVLPDRCLHRGGALHLGTVVGDAIECPYHGWRWRGADGQCVYVPSNGLSAPIPRAAVIGAFPAVERYGLIWTCVGDPLTGPPDLPELESLEITYAAGEPVDVDAGMRVAPVNFSDVAYFPFAHRGTMSKAPQQVSRFEVRREQYETWMTHRYSAANGDSELFRGVEDPTFEYHAVAPGISTVLLDHGTGGKRFAMKAFAPAGPTGSRIFLVSGTAAGYTAYDPAATLAAEIRVLHEALLTLNTLAVPFEREEYELSVEADRYTRATRLSFVEFVRDAGAAVDLSRPR